MTTEVLEGKPALANRVTVHFYRKDVYGAEHCYIVEQGIYEAVYALTGRKTLTGTDRKALERLGFSFQEVLAPRS